MKGKKCLMLVTLLIISLMLLPFGGQAEAVEVNSSSSPVTVRLELRNALEAGEKDSIEKSVYDQVSQQINKKLSSRFSAELREKITNQVMESLVPSLEKILDRPIPDSEKQPSDGKQPPDEEPKEPGKPEDPGEKEDPAEQEEPPTDEDPSFIPEEDEAAMLELVNQERQQAGLEPLQLHSELSEVAREKARDMHENNYFSHHSPQYGSPFDMMREAGISYRYAGENLAMSPTVESAHRNLMNSPGHRANILNERYTHVGIGAVESNRGKIFVQMFMQPN